MGGKSVFELLALQRVGFLVAVLVVCTALLYWIGFSPAIFLLAVILLQCVGHWGWAKSIILSLILAIGLLLVFRLWFKIPLPLGPLPDSIFS